MIDLLDILFVLAALLTLFIIGNAFSGCSHKNLTFPVSVRNSEGVPLAPKQFCLDCGCWRFYHVGSKPGEWRAPRHQFEEVA